MSERAMKVVREYALAKGEESNKKRKRQYSALPWKLRFGKLAEMRRFIKQKEASAKHA